jgi:hypothetical protein
MYPPARRLLDGLHRHRYADAACAAGTSAASWWWAGSLRKHRRLRNRAGSFPELRVSAERRRYRGDLDSEIVLGGTGACSMIAVCDFLRTWGAMAPGGSCRSAMANEGVTDGLDSCEFLWGVGGCSAVADGNVWTDPVAMEYGVSKCERPPPTREKPVFPGDSALSPTGL